jgi:hypothetical protein
MFCVFVGLLLYSKVARYIGALGIGASACITLWAIIWGIIGPNPATSSVPIIFRAAIYVTVFFEIVTVYALLLSKPFSMEFSTLRKSAPEYVNLTRKLILGIMVMYLLWRIYADISNLLLGR